SQEASEEAQALVKLGREEAIAEVQREVAAVMGREPLEVNPKEPLMAMGVDSLLIVEIRNRLASRYSVKLPATLALDYPTVEAIALYLIGEAKKKRKVAAANDEPIAVVGIGLRLPRGVTTADRFWELLS